MILHLPEQILNWGPPTAWWCFPYERRIGELSDTLTSGKSVEEQIFNHFFLQHCADHLPMPVLPCTVSEQLPTAITPLLETKSSDCTSDFYQATYLRRVAEHFFTGEVSSIHTFEITPGDPFELVEKEEVSPFKLPNTNYIRIYKYFTVLRSLHYIATYSTYRTILQYLRRNVLQI